MSCDPDLFVGWHELLPDRHLNFQLNRWVAFGGLRWLADVRPFLDEFSNYGAWCSRFAMLGEQAEAEGRTFHAALHFRAAEFFMLRDDPRKTPLRRRLLPMLQAANGVPDNARSEVVFQNAHLPVWQFGARNPAKTAVVFGGFDSYIEDLFPVLTRLGREGWHAIAFDGPGQGAVLHDQQVPFTPHWHGPVGAVLNALNLDDVTLVGISLGGCLALRAAAFEPRIRRVVAFDVLSDLYEISLNGLPKAVAAGASILMALGFRSAINMGSKRLARNDLQLQWEHEQGTLAFGCSSSYEAFQTSRAFHTRDISHLITQDVLLMAGTDDHFVPIGQLHDQRRLLTSARSVTTRVFAAAEQAQAHCQVGNLPLAIRCISDWMTSRQNA